MTDPTDVAVCTSRLQQPPHSSLCLLADTRDLLPPKTYRADDLIPEESPTAQAALARMSEKERYDRIFRIRRAVQLSIAHKLLPKAEWTKVEEDTPYLAPLIALVEAEIKEREALDTMTVHKSH